LLSNSNLYHYNAAMKEQQHQHQQQDASNGLRQDSFHSIQSLGGSQSLSLRWGLYKLNPVVTRSLKPPGLETP
jgi:hypothetical protein